MKCPHCLVAFHDDVRVFHLESDAEGTWRVDRTHCPACKRFVMDLVLSKAVLVNGQQWVQQEVRHVRVYPRGTGRPPCPKEVLETAPDVAADYVEACLVLTDSPKAAAALARRCLQHTLRAKAGVSPGNLADEIQHVIDAHSLPTQLAENLDAIRQIGNFAAHPTKSRATGEIVDVEPHEAEWCIDVLEGLFDHYFVAPAAAKAKRDALTVKLSKPGSVPKG